MDELADFDLDRSAGRAWFAFQQRLADYLVDMHDDDTLGISARSGLDDDPSAGAAPYIQIRAWGGDKLRIEALSNAYLDRTYALDEAGETRMLSLGWNAPTYPPQERPDAGSENYWLDVERRMGDRVAAMTTRAFREVWSIPHPVFLRADAAGETHPPDLGIADATVEQVGESLPDVILPRDNDHLREVVETVLTHRFGQVPIKDSDGDIPLRSGSALVFVHVPADLPLVTLFSPLVRDISGRTRAAEVVADLNRRWPLVKFVLFDDQVVAMVQLPAAPFAPNHLSTMLEMLSRAADRLDDVLVDRLDGRLAFPMDIEHRRVETVTAEEPDDSFSDELLTLLNIDPNRDGEITPAEVLKLYEDDRRSLLRDIRVTSEQEISWRQSASEATAAGERQVAEACTQEAAAWESTVETLRRALRATIDPNKP
ncbi:MAG: hypothetical protein AVDCRST_MAG29-2411 [uncultured Nocardioidaceae bacterium]|uniref:EF-hand domain-containing protein n=1 Tax=uncultured Nocardioidaceae bacterium TaxID=253824 RepID=A0A6J4MBR6_9ACTN|nr:MAG: hypothetical protein AVDCRST_MAG29-2411 [uncultured Nocardioidaceae bacterium]